MYMLNLLNESRSFSTLDLLEEGDENFPQDIRATVPHFSMINNVTLCVMLVDDFFTSFIVSYL